MLQMYFLTVVFSCHFVTHHNVSENKNDKEVSTPAVHPGEPRSYTSNGGSEGTHNSRDLDLQFYCLLRVAWSYDCQTHACEICPLPSPFTVASSHLHENCAELSFMCLTDYRAAPAE